MNNKSFSTIKYEIKKNIYRILDQEGDFNEFAQKFWPAQNKGFSNTEEMLDEWEKTREGTIANFLNIAKSLQRHDVTDLLEKKTVVDAPSFVIDGSSNTKRIYTIPYQIKKKIYRLLDKDGDWNGFAQVREGLSSSNGAGLLVWSKQGISQH
jgi:hypothetical protein